MEDSAVAPSAVGGQCRTHDEHYEVKTNKTLLIKPFSRLSARENHAICLLPGTGLQPRFRDKLF